MKTFNSWLIFGVLFCLSFSVQAQLNYDTVLVKQAGSGMVLTKINETTHPWAIQVLTIDLKNPYVNLETVKAKNLLEGLERTSQMALRSDSTQNKVVGAINADFFGGTGIPINMQICNGEIVRKPNGLSTFGINKQNEPVIMRPVLTGKIKGKNAELAINTINATRNANELVLYNSFMGSGTETNAYGTEISCIPITPWVVNDTVWVKASAIEENTGNMSLSKGMAVLSGHGTAADFLSNNVAIGDTLAIILSTDAGPKQLTQLIGAYPRIIKDGENYVDQGYAEEGGPSHTYERHPRTAVGFSADSTLVYMVTVDGRQASSVGMTLPELADFMVMIGVSDAVNLDGGGSTTMVVNHQIENSPSDATGERNVSNALMAISTAPEGTLNYIKLYPNPLKIRYGSQGAITLNAYDQYDNLLTIDTSLVEYSTTGDAGTLINEQFFAANGTETQGTLTANYQGFSDAIAIAVIPLDTLWIEAEATVTDSIRPVQLRAFSTNLNTTDFELLPELVTWEVSDTKIGSVNKDGVFTGLKTGFTTITAYAGERTATLQIEVKIIRDFILLDNMETPESWTVTTEFMDSVKLQFCESPKTEGNGSMQIFYQFTNMGRVPSFTIAKTMDTEGFPDSLWIDARFDGENQRVSYQLFNQSNSNVLSYSAITNPQKFRLTGSEIPMQAMADYPMQLQAIKVEFMKNEAWEANATYSGTIYLDNLRISYPGHTPIVVSIEPEIPDNEELLLFPNPASNQVFCQLSKSNITLATFRVFDLNGKQLLNIPNTKGQVSISTENLQSGIYLIQCVLENQVLTKKLVIQH